MDGRRASAWRRALGTTLALVVTISLAAVPQDVFAIVRGLQGPTIVERIIDGDTLVLVGGERVRLIGVDAPEVGEPFADAATAFLAALVHAQPVFLELDVGERDVYGRLLAYVYVEDRGGAWVTERGRRFTQANHALATAGLATTMTIPPNVAYAEVFLEATRAAREARLGLWRLWFCVDLNTSPPERLLEIVHIDEVRARHLVELRPYASLDDLTRVPGIGAARLADIEEQGIVCPFE